MKKFISVLLVLCLAFSITCNVFAAANETELHAIELHSSNKNGIETVFFIYGGELYTFVREELTNGDVNASIQNSAGTYITNMTYNRHENSIHDAVSNVFYAVPDMENTQIIEPAADVPYRYVGTTKGSVDTGDGVFVIATFIAALMPGVGWGALVTVVGYFIQKGCPTIYYEVDLYMYSDDEYDYVKRELRMYEKSNYTGQLGDTLVGYQKKSNQW